METLIQVLDHNIYSDKYHIDKIWSDEFNDYCDYEINENNIIIKRGDDTIKYDENGKNENGDLMIHPSKELRYMWDVIGTKYTILNWSDTCKKNRTKLKALGIINNDKLIDMYMNILEEDSVCDVIVWYDRMTNFYMMNYLNFNYDKEIRKFLMLYSVEIDINI